MEQPRSAPSQLSIVEVQAEVMRAKSNLAAMKSYYATIKASRTTLREGPLRRYEEALEALEFELAARENAVPAATSQVLAQRRAADDTGGFAPGSVEAALYRANRGVVDDILRLARDRCDALKLEDTVFEPDRGPRLPTAAAVDVGFLRWSILVLDDPSMLQMAVTDPRCPAALFRSLMLHAPNEFFATLAPSDAALVVQRCLDYRLRDVMSLLLSKLPSGSVIAMLGGCTEHGREFDPAQRSLSAAIDMGWCEVLEALYSTMRCARHNEHDNWSAAASPGDATVAKGRALWPSVPSAAFHMLLDCYDACVSERPTSVFFNRPIIDERISHAENRLLYDPSVHIRSCPGAEAPVEPARTEGVYSRRGSQASVPFHTAEEVTLDPPSLIPYHSNRHVFRTGSSAVAPIPSALTDVHSSVLGRRADQGLKLDSSTGGSTLTPTSPVGITLPVSSEDTLSRDFSSEPRFGRSASQLRKRSLRMPQHPSTSKEEEVDNNTEDTASSSSVLNFPVTVRTDTPVYRGAFFYAVDVPLALLLLPGASETCRFGWCRPCFPATGCYPALLGSDAEGSSIGISFEVYRPPPPPPPAPPSISKRRRASVAVVRTTARDRSDSVTVSTSVTVRRDKGQPKETRPPTLPPIADWAAARRLFSDDTVEHVHAAEQPSTTAPWRFLVRKHYKGHVCPIGTTVHSNIVECGVRDSTISVGCGINTITGEASFSVNFKYLGVAYDGFVVPEGAAPSCAWYPAATLHATFPREMSELSRTEQFNALEAITVNFSFSSTAPCEAWQQGSSPVASANRGAPSATAAGRPKRAASSSSPRRMPRSVLRAAAAATGSPERRGVWKHIAREEKIEHMWRLLLSYAALIGASNLSTASLSFLSASDAPITAVVNRFSSVHRRPSTAESAGWPEGLTTVAMTAAQAPAFLSAQSTAVATINTLDQIKPHLTASVLDPDVLLDGAFHGVFTHRPTDHSLLPALPTPLENLTATDDDTNAILEPVIPVHGLDNSTSHFNALYPAPAVEGSTPSARSSEETLPLPWVPYITRYLAVLRRRTPRDVGQSALAASPLPVVDFPEVLPYIVSKTPSLKAPPLCACLRYNHVLLARVLAAVPCVNINQPDEQGFTPLMHAIVLGQHELTRFLLLEREASIVPINYAGYTAMHLALLHDKDECVRILLSHPTAVDRAALDARTPGHRSTCLALAVKKNRPEFVSAFIARGASVTTPDKSGVTPLLFACRAGMHAVASMLLKQGYFQYSRERGSLNYRERRPPRGSALLYAALDGHTDLCRRMLDLGVETSVAFEPHNVSPVHAAIHSGSLDCATTLISSGRFNCSSAERLTGSTPLHFLMERGYASLLDIVLHVPGIDPNVQNSEGYTPLMLGILHGHTRCAVSLIVHQKRRLRAELVDRTGRTALCIAAESGNVAVIEALLDVAHANVNYVSGASSMTPLVIAIYHGRVEAAEAIISLSKNRLDVNNQRCGSPQTPLFAALSRGFIRLCRLLLDCGAFVSSAHLVDFIKNDRFDSSPIIDPALVPKELLRQSYSAPASYRGGAPRSDLNDEDLLTLWREPPTPPQSAPPLMSLQHATINHSLAIPRESNPFYCAATHQARPAVAVLAFVLHKMARSSTNHSADVDAVPQTLSRPLRCAAAMLDCCGCAAEAVVLLEQAIRKSDNLTTSLAVSPIDGSALPLSAKARQYQDSAASTEATPTTAGEVVARVEPAPWRVVSETLAAVDPDACTTNDGILAAARAALKVLMQRLSEEQGDQRTATAFTVAGTAQTMSLFAVEPVGYEFAAPRVTARLFEALRQRAPSEALHSILRRYPIKEGGGLNACFSRRGVSLLNVAVLTKNLSAAEYLIGHSAATNFSFLCGAECPADAMLTYVAEAEGLATSAAAAAAAAPDAQCLLTSGDSEAAAPWFKQQSFLDSAERRDRERRILVVESSRPPTSVVDRYRRSLTCGGRGGGGTPHDATPESPRGDSPVRRTMTFARKATPKTPNTATPPPPPLDIDDDYTNSVVENVLLFDSPIVVAAKIGAIDIITAMLQDAAGDDPLPESARCVFPSDAPLCWFSPRLQNLRQGLLVAWCGPFVAAPFSAIEASLRARQSPLSNAPTPGRASPTIPQHTPPEDPFARFDRSVTPPSRNGSPQGPDSASAIPRVVTTTLLHLLIESPALTDADVIGLITAFELPPSATSVALCELAQIAKRKAVPFFSSDASTSIESAVLFRLRTSFSAFAQGIRCRRVSLVQWLLVESHRVQPEDYAADVILRVAINHCPQLLPLLLSIWAPFIDRSHSLSDASLSASQRRNAPQPPPTLSSSSAHFRHLRLPSLSPTASGGARRASMIPPLSPSGGAPLQPTPAAAPRAETSLLTALVRGIVSLPQREELTAPLQALCVSVLSTHPDIAWDQAPNDTGDREQADRTRRNAQLSLFAQCAWRQCFIVLGFLVKTALPKNPAVLVDRFDTPVDGCWSSVQLLQRARFSSGDADTLYSILSHLEQPRDRRLLVESVASRCHPAVFARICFQVKLLQNIQLPPPWTAPNPTGASQQQGSVGPPAPATPRRRSVGFAFTSTAGATVSVCQPSEILQTLFAGLMELCISGTASQRGPALSRQLEALKPQHCIFCPPHLAAAALTLWGRTAPSRAAITAEQIGGAQRATQPPPGATRHTKRAPRRVPLQSPGAVSLSPPDTSPREGAAMLVPIQPTTSKAAKQWNVLRASTSGSQQREELTAADIGRIQETVYPSATASAAVSKALLAFVKASVHRASPLPPVDRSALCLDLLNAVRQGRWQRAPFTWGVYLPGAAASLKVIHARLRRMLSAAASLSSDVPTSTSPQAEEPDDSTDELEPTSAGYTMQLPAGLVRTSSEMMNPSTARSSSVKLLRLEGVAERSLDVVHRRLLDCVAFLSSAYVAAELNTVPPGVAAGSSAAASGASGAAYELHFVTTELPALPLIAAAAAGEKRVKPNTGAHAVPRITVVDLDSSAASSPAVAQSLDWLGDVLLHAIKAGCVDVLEAVRARISLAEFETREGPTRTAPRTTRPPPVVGSNRRHQGLSLYAFFHPLLSKRWCWGKRVIADEAPATVPDHAADSTVATGDTGVPAGLDATELIFRDPDSFFGTLPRFFYALLIRRRLHFVAAASKRAVALEYLLVNPCIAKDRDPEGRTLADYVFDDTVVEGCLPELLAAVDSCLQVLLHARSPLSRGVLEKMRKHPDRFHIVAIRAPQHGDTLLHNAVLNAQDDVVEWLLGDPALRPLALVRNVYGMLAWQYATSAPMLRSVMEATAAEALPPRSPSGDRTAAALLFVAADETLDVDDVAPTDTLGVDISGRPLVEFAGFVASSTFVDVERRALLQAAEEARVRRDSSEPPFGAKPHSTGGIIVRHGPPSKATPVPLELIKALWRRCFVCEGLDSAGRVTRQPSRIIAVRVAMPAAMVARRVHDIFAEPRSETTYKTRAACSMDSDVRSGGGDDDEEPLKLLLGLLAHAPRAWAKGCSFPTGIDASEGAIIAAAQAAFTAALYGSQMTTAAEGGPRYQRYGACLTPDEATAAFRVPCDTLPLSVEQRRIATSFAATRATHAVDFDDIVFQPFYDVSER